jgi:manganese transport protein
MIICLIVGLGVLLTGMDPIKITELSVVFSAIALPLTYLPILVVANDPEYMGEQVNGAVTNAAGVFYLIVILVASLAAVPLLIITGAGS